MKTETIDLSHTYRLLNHGPAVLVSTTDGAVPNACTVAWCAPVSKNPPRFVLAISDEHKTWANLAATRECVLNLTTIDALEALWLCGTETGHDGDKLGPAGIEVFQSRVVAPPRLACCVAWIETRLIESLTRDDMSLVIVEAVAAETLPGVIDAHGHLDVARHRTLHHLGGSRFMLPGEVIGRA